MKKVSIIFTSLIFGLLVLVGCQKISTYKFISDGFDDQVIYDEDNEKISLEGLYVEDAKEHRTPITYDMVISGGDTNSVGVNDLVVSYAGLTYTFNYSVYYEVTFTVNGEAYKKEYVFDVSELTVPEAPDVIGFVAWEEIPSVITSNLEIKAKIQKDETPDTPNLTTISATYGDTLADLALPSNDLGKWEFVLPSTTSVGEVGTHAFDVLFIPNDPLTYNEVEGTVEVEVGKKHVEITVPETSFVYTGSEITLPYELDVEEDLKVDAIGLTGTNAGTYNYFIQIDDPNYEASAFGSWVITPRKITITVESNVVEYSQIGSLEDPKYTVSPDIPEADLEKLNIKVSNPQSANNVGTYEYEVTYDENPNYEVEIENGTLEIVKSVYDATIPTLTSDVYYGDTLTSDDLSSVAGGTWVLTEDEVYLDKAGMTSVSITFIPNDDKNYDGMTTTLTFDVKKKKLEIKVTKSEFTYDGTSHSLEYEIIGLIPGDEVNVVGNKSLVDAGVVNDINLVVESENYEGSLTDQRLEVLKANPTYDVPSLSATYLDKLGDVLLPKGFTWNNPDTTINEVGELSYKATYTPEDTNNYNILTNIDLKVVVNKMQGVITTINDSYAFMLGDNITLGQITSNHNETSIITTIKYNDNVVEDYAKSGYYDVTYTQEESEHYLAATKTIKVLIVDKLDSITLTYEEGRKLSDIILTESPYGTYQFTNPNTLVYAGYGQAFDVTFTSNEGLEVKTNITLNVGKKTLEFTITQDTFTYNGEEQSVIYTLPVEGLKVSESGTSMTNAGTSYYTLTIEDNNYQGTAPGTLKILPKDVTISASDTTMNYGETVPKITLVVEGLVGSDTLNASYKKPEITSIGDFTYTITYDENSNYNVKVQTVYVHVNKGNLTAEDVTLPTVSNITYGDYLNNSILIGGSSGTWSIDDTTPLLTAGSHEIAVTFISSNANYNPYHTKVTVTVNKKTLTITITNCEFTYDATSHEVTYEISGKVNEGDEVKVSGNESQVNAGSYKVTLTIEDDNYEGSKTTTLIINKATPKPKMPQSMIITWGPNLTLESEELKLTSDDNAGTWAYVNGQTLEMGTKTYNIKYTPTDITNYNEVTDTISITVNKKASSISLKETSITLYYNGQDKMSELISNVTKSNDEGYESEGELIFIVSDSIITELKDVGTYTVSVYQAESTHYQQSETLTFTVTILEGEVNSYPYEGYYGQKLGDIYVPGSSQGTWMFSNPNQVLEQIGKNNYTLEFTPNGGTSVTETISVHVTVKKRPVKIEAEGKTYTYNKETYSLDKPSVVVDALEGASGYTVDTTKYEITPSGTSSAINAGTYEVTYTLNSDVYEASEVTVKLVINPKEVTISGSDQTVKYGETVPEITPTVEGVVDGDDLNVTATKPTFDCIGTYNYIINYDKTNTNYNVTVNQVKLTVIKGDLTGIEAPSLSVTYGDSSSSINITNSYEETGHFEITSAIKDVIKANFTDGKFVVDVKFVPTNTNYNEIEFSGIEVTITKRQLTINITSDLSITYDGQEHSLDYTVSNLKDDEYSEVTITDDNKFTNAGTYEVTFTVESEYYEGTETVTFVIKKANPSYTMPENISATYGTKLSDVQLPSDTNGTWSWQNENLVVSSQNSSTFEATAIYTPTDTQNYITLEATITIEQIPAENKIISSEYYIFMFAGSDITLQELKLSSTSGSLQFTMKENGNIIPSISTQGIHHIVIEQDATYTHQAATKEIVVILIESQTTQNVTYGDKMPSLTSSYGTWSWEDNLTIVNFTGNQTKKAIFTATESGKTYTKEFDITFEVNKRLLTVKDITDHYTYDGQEHKVTFNVYNLVSGDTVDIKPSISAQTNAGSYEYELTLDDDRYDIEETKGTLVINPATTDVTIESESGSQTVSSGDTSPITFVQKYYEYGKAGAQDKFGFSFTNSLVKGYTVTVNETAVTGSSYDIDSYGHYEFKVAITDPNFVEYSFTVTYDIYIAEVTTSTTYRSESGKGYTSIDDAIVASQNAQTPTYIFVYGNGVIGEKEKNLTLGQNVELFIPASQNEIYYLYDEKAGFDDNDVQIKKEVNEYLNITISEDTTLEVEGRITVGADRGQNHVGGTGSGSIEADVRSTYSTLTLNGNISLSGELFVVGYVKGTGTIDTASGAEIYEPFILTDWRGGQNAAAAYLLAQIVPFNQYSMHHIETRLIVRYGVNYIGLAGIYTSMINVGWNTTDYPVIGAGAIFELQDASSYIVKSYDSKSEKSTIEIHGNVQDNYGTLTIDILGNAFPLSTKDLYFSIPRNVKIVVTEGSTFTVRNYYKMLPGSEVIIKENATMNLEGNLIVYKDYVDKNNAYGETVYGDPDYGKAKYPTGLEEPKLIVNGTLKVTGSFAGIARSEGSGILDLSNASALELKTIEGYGDLFNTSTLADFVTSYQHLKAYNVGALGVTVTWEPDTANNYLLKSELESYALDKKVYVWSNDKWVEKTN